MACRPESRRPRSHRTWSVASRSPSGAARHRGRRRGWPPADMGGVGGQGAAPDVRRDIHSPLAALPHAGDAQPQRGRRLGSADAGEQSAGRAVRGPCGRAGRTGWGSAQRTWRTGAALSVEVASSAHLRRRRWLSPAPPPAPASASPPRRRRRPCAAATGGRARGNRGVRLAEFPHARGARVAGSVFFTSVLGEGTKIQEDSGSRGRAPSSTFDPIAPTRRCPICSGGRPQALKPGGWLLPSHSSAPRVRERGRESRGREGR